MSSQTLDRPVSVRRGGNRLGPDHPHRSWTPTYRRQRSWVSDPDPERRDRNQRNRMRRCVAVGVHDGTVSPGVGRVLLVLFEAADDRMSSTWWSLAYIARLILGDDRYGDDPAGGQRTAGRWMADLGRAGWVERQHRFVAEGGQVRGTSNLWRFTIPAPLRQGAVAVEDAARAEQARQHQRPGKGRSTPKAPQHRPSGPQEPARTAPSYRDQDLRRSSPCPTCEGRRFVELPDGRVTACGACDAKGHQVTHPPP